MGKKIYLVILLLCSVVLSFAQDTIIMPVTGHKDTTASSLVLYDDGGYENPHSVSTNATYTISTKTPGNYFRINIYQKLHADNKNIVFFRIYNGDTTSNDVLYSCETSSTVSYLYYSTKDTITVKFKTDDDNPLDGFVIGIEEVYCPSRWVSCSFEDANTAILRWDTTDGVDYYVVEYVDTTYQGYNCSTPRHVMNDSANYNKQIVTTDADSVLLEDLGSCRYLYYNVYGMKIVDDDTLMCSGYIDYSNNYYSCYTPPECKSVYPQNVIYEYNDAQDSVFFTWDDIDSVTWYVRDNWSTPIKVDTPYYAQALSCNSSNRLDIVGDTTGSVNFCNYYYGYFYMRNCRSLPTTSYRYKDYVYYDASTTYDNYSGWIRYGDVGVSNQYNTISKSIYKQIGVASVGPDSITLIWEKEKSTYNPDTITTNYVISWRKSNDYYTTPNYDTISFDDTTYTIRDLDSNTSYYIEVEMLCPYCKQYASRTISTTLGTCMDFTDLLSKKTFLTWGDYNNPHEGFFDTIYSKAYYYRIGGDTNTWFAYEDDDRHVVMRDTTQTDWRTNWQLRCVPEGEVASIRLGNSSVGREAESISYEYFVDSNDKDMLVLKYAVVMQDPGHTRENQPRFTLEILDSTNQVIDTTCCFADFYAAGDLGWNEVANSSPKIIWKDWTTVGIDIAPYHGQTIRVRLTTYDCDEGEHYGYAYFNIRCDNKRLYIVDKCDHEDSVWLQAPLGFDYYWHQVGKTDTLSNTFEVQVPVDDNVYECVASFVGKPDCYFTISTVPVHVSPIADAIYTIDTCDVTVQYINKSYTLFDTTLGVYTKQFINNIKWIDNDGNESRADTLTVKYPGNGVYNVQLISFLSNSQCIDTLTIPVTIDFILEANIEAKDTLCYGAVDTLKLKTDSLYTYNYSVIWDDGQTVSDRIITADTARDYEIVINRGDLGCNDTLKHSLFVTDIYNDTIYATIVEGQTYKRYNFTQTQEGIYTDSLQSMFGCDSVVTLNLDVIEVYDTVVNVEICEGSIFSYEDLFYHNTQGSFVDTMYFDGYDSVFTFNITVNPVKSRDSIFSSCVGDTFYFYDTRIFRSGSYAAFLETYKGCDSVIYLDVTFNYITDSYLEVDICPDQPFYFNDIVIETPGVYMDTLKTSKGCDSVVHIVSVMYDVQYASVEENICEGESFDFNGRKISSAGLYDDTLQSIHGCDSIITLNLHVIPTKYNYTKTSVCEGETYEFKGEQLYETGYYIDTLQSYDGCDSIVELDLRVTPLYDDTTYMTLNEGTEIALGEIRITKDGQYTYKFKTIDDCDSIVTFVVMYQSGLEQPQEVSVLLYPNPTKNSATLQLDNLNSTCTVTLVDASGKKIKEYYFEQDSSTKKIIIDTDNLVSGSYYVQIKTNGGIKTEKLIKQ